MTGESAAIDALCALVGPTDRQAGRLGALRLRTLARPHGALGRLDDLVPRIAMIRSDPDPGPLPALVSVLAADHGLARRAVSALPQPAGGRVLALVQSGRAPLNLIADRVPARVVSADFGLVEPVGEAEFRMGAGTEDICLRDAMTRADAERAVLSGARFLRSRLGEETMVAVGEIGVGNTTAAAALTGRLLELPVAAVVGAGSGVDPAAVARKHALVERALIRTAGLPGTDTLAQLAALGGYEIAGNVGVILAAAAARRVVVLDGFITAVAALIAVRLCPPVGHYLVAAHRSAEPGHRPLLQALGLDPLLDLGLRLGVASGAALALGLVNTTLELAHRTPRARDVGLALPAEDG
ncbi:nicotinate-nucleotide--dimethylbenzimidazole phosphoribosyltransferase [Kitasatospora sp. NBC_01266]|uniref:nicotinate-nucleotide--dimethylbenzimidazole phosphoribosyltransferase n=1 Tax=Kitasatospora sp. NBC_01266 TaxID=2903572 RepID=UPI002E3659E7|nr:nicotinate-nucleotide--dimethylbenzimidazole phosphoribosyltransferase [Kitasatospora sp. NBC_01266]